VVTGGLIPVDDQEFIASGFGSGLETSSVSDSKTLFIPFGHRCSSAAILDKYDLCDESLPFDSVVSKLNVIRDCLENGFGRFLDATNYVKVKTLTVNVIDGSVEVCCDELPNVNRYYEDAIATSNPKTEDLTNRSTYHLQLALTHHDLSSAEDYASFSRRCARLDAVLKQDRRKVYIYIHPIMGIKDYDEGRAGLVEMFLAFSEFMARRFTNIFGLFFIVVKHEPGGDPGCSVEILASESCNAHVIYANQQFVDAGAPFSGDFEREAAVMADIIKEHST
jgi:hypothetical protein